MIFALNKFNVFTCIALSTVLAACIPSERKEWPPEELFSNQQASSLGTTQGFDDIYKKSYSVGSQFGLYAFEYIKNQKEFFEPLDEATILQGFSDSIRQNHQIDVKTTGLILSGMKHQIKQRNIKISTKGKVVDGEKYLFDNAKKDGVFTTTSGLQYEIISQSTGEKPTLQDVVTVHYQGKLIDGTVFDSSYSDKKPGVFLVSKVIKGWIEGLQLMSVGSKFKFTIPQELAYGRKNVKNGMIPAYSTLIFDIELLSLEKSNDK